MSDGYTAHAASYELSIWCRRVAARVGEGAAAIAPVLGYFLSVLSTAFLQSRVILFYKWHDNRFWNEHGSIWQVVGTFDVALRQPATDSTGVRVSILCVIQKQQLG